MKRILFIPPGIQGGWYMEAHYEYLIRYLSDEFFIEQAQVPYPPYDNFLDRFPETSPLERNPDDYDLIIPILPSHWGLADDQHEKYSKKVAVIMYEPGEGDWWRAEYLGLTTPVVEAGDYSGKKAWSLRFGIDTELFKPIKMKREDDLLHIGVIGSYGNPRRQVIEGMKPLFDMPGVKWDFYPVSWVNKGGTPETIERLGGRDFINRVVTGGKYWPGIPNLYNRMDVLVRIDNSYGYSFPTLEAASCEVPVITTYQGIDHHITEAGGGILLTPDGATDMLRWPSGGKEEELVSKLKSAIEFMRDHPKKRKEMGRLGRQEVTMNWQWKHHIDEWRKFLREVA